MQSKDGRTCPLSVMITYSTGECAFSLVNNSLIAFAAIYYTDALGLKPYLAGIAMFVAILWDAVSDPIMGHISDNTRSRFGKRHPYILFGGLALVLSFYFLWRIPQMFTANTTYLFWYLVGINLMLRTAFTVFIVPYTALGFEICSDYAGRTKLQGIRLGMNMVANISGVALGWYVFFRDRGDVRGVSIPDNFVNMGMVFSLASLVIILFVFFATLKHIKDSRDVKLTGNTLKAFFVDMREIILDKYPRWVFAYTLVVMLGIALAGSFQGHLYEHFMKFDSISKSIAHGTSMVLTALGGLAASVLVRRFDKKGAVYIGVVTSVIGNVLLAVLFLSGLLKPGQAITFMGMNVPIVFIIFTLLHGCYWMGNGVLFPVAVSMMADVSEIHEIETGINKDGAYSAMHSFTWKVSLSVGTLVSMACLTLIGFIAGEQSQSTDVVWRLGAVTLLAGPLISLTALFLIRKYPVSEDLIEKMRTEATDNAV